MRYWPQPLAFQPTLWIHAVSVGEIQIARSLLAHLGNPGRVLLTTTTQAGYKILRESYGDESARYLPWDLPGCYHRLFSKYDVPDLLVVETEIWPLLFQFVSRAGAKLVIVNGRVSKRTLRMQKNPLFRRTLAYSSYILARGERDRQRFLAFGLPPNRVTAVGNIKFDFKPKQLPASIFKRWLQSAETLILFASISSDEAKLLSGPLTRLLGTYPRLRVLWVPRHLERLEVHLEALTSLKPLLRSALDTEQGRLLVLDSIGELSLCYGFAYLSLVGGSFNGRGGQNFLESLQAGAPVILGPSTSNFQDEVEGAQRAGALVVLAQPDEIEPAIGALLHNVRQREQMSLAAAGFLAEHGGALVRTGKKLLSLGIISEDEHKGEDT